MPGESEELPAWIRRYALAVCCVVLPLCLALVTFNLAINRLTPNIVDSIASTLTYVPAQPKPDKPTKQPAISTTTAGPAEATKPPAAATTDAADSDKSLPPAAAGGSGKPKAGQEPAGPDQDATADPALFLRGLTYRGEAQYAAASAFIYLASTAVLLFSVVIVYRRWKLIGCLVSLVIFTVIGTCIAFHFQKPLGRELVVENLLNKAELFPTMKLDGAPVRLTGDIVSNLVSVNTIAALVPVGMLLVALAALSVRDPDTIPKTADLMFRRTCLRLALALGSALFVIGVIANKVLVQWPLSLVSEPQRLALQPVADSVTMQLGTMGTIAIIAAFAPALAAWWLDVQNYEGDKAAKAEAAIAARNVGLIPIPNAAQPAKATPQDSDSDSSKASSSEFAFAPLSIVSGIIAALAPLLASPFVDTLKSALSVFAGK
jgi:hypothetical protein